jgi:DNA-binding NtrC family response regulator
VLSQLRDIAVLDGVESPQKITHVLLSGERGVGKELIAKLIHDWSRRNRETYQVINLGGIARELAVAELFRLPDLSPIGLGTFRKRKMERCL